MKPPKLLALIPGLLLLQYATPCCGETGDLQGKWQVVAVPEGWKKLPGLEVLVRGNCIHIRYGAVRERLRYTLDASRGTIDAVKEGKGNAGIRRAVYRTTGETLTISVGARGKARPASADCTEGGASKWVLRRVSREG